MRSYLTAGVRAKSPRSDIDQRLIDHLTKFPRGWTPVQEGVVFHGRAYPALGLMRRKGTTSAEGMAFVVREKKGTLAVIKDFYSLERAIDTEREFKALENSGKPVAKVLSREGKKIEFEYVEGYTLLELKDLKDAGVLSDLEYRLYVTRYESEILPLEDEIYGGNFHYANVVYSPRLARFLVVDLR